MESLESKLDRLNPEQRREVEDFVDFLINRFGGTSPAAPIAPLQVPPPIRATPTLMPIMEHESLLESGSAGSWHPSPVVESPSADREEPAATIQEIVTPDDDPISRDYMDYGKFDESPPSPAAQAVEKVKRKIIQKQAQDKTSHLLEWID
jgi:hypothetical protein